MIKMEHVLQYNGCQYLLQIQEKVCFITELFFSLLMKQAHAKMSLHILQGFCRSQPSVSWFCFTGGTVAPSGHLSLIDDTHMWAPYVSWQGQHGEVTLETRGP